MTTLQEWVARYPGDPEALIDALVEETERLRHPWRAVDDMDWDFIMSTLGYGGRERFWRAVLTEMRDALITSPLLKDAT